MPTSLRERLAQLLDDPFGCWVAGHVEMQNPAPPVLDHKETVQQLECHRRHSEEIECGDHLAMILLERQPAPGTLTTTANALQIACHAPLRNNKTKLLKFAVDPRGSPIPVLLRQALDQCANFAVDLRPAAAWPRSPPLIKAEAGAMPADHGVGLHDDQDVGPAGPTVAESGPEKAIQGVQFGPWPLSLEDCDLLSEGQYLEGGIT
jgi:hypothetical protein